MRSASLASYLLIAVIAANPRPLSAQSGSERIRLNQIGFYPTAPKIAIVVDAPEGTFFVTTPQLGDTLFTGALSGSRSWSASADPVRRADFSALQAEGQFVVTVPGIGTSHVFEIGRGVHDTVSRAGLKSFYFQRASSALDEQYAGKWHRRAGHPDTEVVVHGSAATAERPAGTEIASPRGWYDAGDYNKYVVNSGITVGTLLSLYEDYPDHLDTLDLDIPETGNGLPDLLDEVLWNVRWMLTMQEPDDGGVYHKLTTANFESFVMPDKATSTRYVVQKSTPAALNFAAVAAQSARIFSRFEADLPGLADSCAVAARAAWRWARQNPEIRYSQSALNAAFDPDINTGEYGDASFTDEFAWAAAELFATTREDSFLTAVDVFFAPNYTVPYWGRVETLGYYTLFRIRTELTGLGAQYAAQALSKVMALASGVNANAAGTAYGVAMGKTSGDFVWGSNGVAANQAIALIYGYLAGGDRKYIELALANLDYLLGRNATSYSFVTGHGDKTPRFPHHRQSGSDGIPDPVPGLLVGGPNPGRQDGCVYPSTFPAESYSDAQCSYASNENAINWSAAFGYLVTAIEALKSDAGFTSVVSESPERDLGAVPAIKSVFPNPFREQATISFSVDRPQRVQVDVTDQLGRRVGVARQMEVRSGSNQTVVDGHSLPPGVYFVTLTGEQFRESFKFVQLR